MSKFEFNASDFKFISIYFVIAFIWLTYRWNIENYTTYEIITGHVGVVIKNSLLLYIFKCLVNRFLLEKRKYFLFFIMFFIYWEAVGFLDMLRDYYTAATPWEYPSFGTMLIQNFYRSLFDSSLLISFVFGKKYYENELNYMELRSLKNEMELKALRTQFDPHFLYNSLNTIDALIDHSPKVKVKEYLSHLALLYRYIVQTKDQDIVPLNDEIELAKNYFYLIETRFGDDYKFKFKNLKGHNTKYLPNGSLLTVLENVVKHNSASDGISISTSISIEQDYLNVVNTRNPMLIKNNTHGTGLDNLRKRYKLLSDQLIKIDTSTDKFSISLPLLVLID